MTTTANDLFAGFGGWSEGARQAGVEVKWAANHWQSAVDWHHANHPTTKTKCQDLQQANWEEVEPADMLLASPCCQGHSDARGKDNGKAQHDASRSTAWAVPSACEFHRYRVVIVENVKGLLKWVLYPAWCAAMQALGYSIAPHIVDCADLGVPQNRVRVFIVCTLSKAPLMLDQYLKPEPHIPATSFIDFDAGNWSMLHKPGRAVATLARAANGRKRHGDRFIMPFYGSGSGLTGRSIDRPVGTITTHDRWLIVDGDRTRIFSADENMLAMSFPAGYKRPNSHKLTVHLAGNAVPPLAARKVLQAIQAAI